MNKLDRHPEPERRVRREAVLALDKPNFPHRFARVPSIPQAAVGLASCRSL
jgi:hypothetical protein